MNGSNPIAGRRRFLTIMASSLAVAALASPDALAEAAREVPLRRWSGTSLGAEAQILLYHADAAEADRLIGLALQEVARLEQVFSLYRPDSAIRRLNQAGELRYPPFELVQLLAQSRHFSEHTGGAFDVTVQPLWKLYETHFGRPDADPSGPPLAAIAAARARVDYRRIDIDLERIAFRQSGMAITLNGIAQGFITDRVTDLLRRNGLHNVLVDLDEYRALGPRPDGAPWAVGIENPRRPGSVIKTVQLSDRAMGTSGGYGTSFDASGHFNHIFDPASGHCAQRYASVTVVAASGTTADALSTAFSVMAPQAVQAAVAAIPGTSVITIGHDGRVSQLGAPVDWAGA